MAIFLPSKSNLRWLLLFLSLLSLSLFLAPTESGKVVPLPRGKRHLAEATGRGGEALMVELTGPPKIHGGEETSLRSQQEAFLSKLKERGVHCEIRATFRMLVNAISLHILDGSSSAGAIANMTEVRTVYYNFLITSPDLQPITKETLRGDLSNDNSSLTEVYQLVSPHNRTGVAKVHSELGLTGKGIKVGVIDTGLDYRHPAFGACKAIGTPGCRVAYGWDLVGNAFDASSSNPDHQVPRPGPDPQDCRGHGTHVSGIIGAQDRRGMGVAPDAVLGVYKVFGCSGSSATDVVVQAMERAFEDGMDVINLSLADVPSWPQELTAATAQRLVDNGRVVVIGMGNAGSLGLWQTPSPAVADDALAVASTDNDYLLQMPFFQVVPGGGIRYFFYSPPYMADRIQNGPLRISPHIHKPDDGCSAYPEGRFKNKIVLVRNGTCSYLTKALNVQEAGASMVLLMFSETSSEAELKDSALHIPVGILGEAVAESLLAVVGDEDTDDLGRSLRFSLEEVARPIPSAGQVSTFSNWGLGPNLYIKPDISAPGGYILSTFPISLGSYSTEKGTSMATPYIAGVAALYLEAARSGRFSLPPAPASGKLLKQYIQNNAVPVKHPELPLHESVGRQGAGLINAYKLLTARTVVSPAVLRLGFAPTKNHTIRMFLNVTNYGNRPADYEFTHEPAVSVDVTVSSRPSAGNRPSSVRFEPARLEAVAPRTSRRISVFITADQSLPQDQRWLYSGYIRVEDSRGNSPLYVPYGGIKGDYRDYPVFAGGTDAPYVRSLSPENGGKIYRSPTETALFTFDAQMQDFPSFYLWILHPARLITLELYNQQGERLGYIAYWEFVGPSTRERPKEREANFRSATWPTLDGRPAVYKDGTRKEVLPVKDGEYVVQAVAQKALGNKKKDFEIWTSPKIIIKTATSAALEP